jgi:hypothetical protein
MLVPAAETNWQAAAAICQGYTVGFHKFEPRQIFKIIFVVTS